MPLDIVNVAFYADDPHRLATFWAAALGYPPPEQTGYAEWAISQGVAEPEARKRSFLAHPSGSSPHLYFQHADAPKRHRNRLHLDLKLTREGDSPVSDEDREGERDRLVALGATVVRLVEQMFGPVREHYFQMQDPEGNEFCLE